MFIGSKHLLAAAAAVAVAGTSAPAQAQEKYLGEIFQVGFNFCPRGSLDASGQLLAISQWSALFSLYGTTYGGDGRTTFGLPDLRGRVAIHTGNGPGLSNYAWGQRGGVEQVTLNVTQMPSHNHTATLQGEAQTIADSRNPTGHTLARAIEPIYSRTVAPDAADALHPDSIVVNNTGGSQAHENRQPYLATRYCIVSQGIYPSRN